MANDFYTATGTPTSGAQVSSSDFRAEFLSIEEAFDKLADLTGKAGYVLRVKSDESGHEAVAFSTLLSETAPSKKVIDFTVGANEAWIINNKSDATLTVTLPAAASYSGREICFKNLKAYTVVSASSNVEPIDSTIAGTAILPATVGAWAKLVSDGTNWIIMQEGQ